MTILPNAIYRFNAILIKLPMAFFTELEQNNYTIHMETQKTLNSQISLEKEEWRWRNQPSWLQIILQATDVKTIWYWHKNRNIGQWNRIESPEITLHTYGYLIYDKGGRLYNGEKKSLFNKWCWENWTSIYLKN